jgi:hypothetical protein
MSDIISSLSSRTGIDPDQIRKGLGSVLKMLQDQLPPEQFSKVHGAVPEAHAMMADSESEAKDPEAGGMLQAVTSLAGKLFGNRGEAATDLFTRLGQHGFSADQLKAFLPHVLDLLKDKLPPEALAKIEGLVPGLSEVAASGDS